MSESTLEGTRLGAYRIEKQLGEGAMGEVFLAVHEALGRQVAIKKLKPQVAADRAMTERFFAEARAVNIIRHENIVECTDLVNEAGTSYIVMELLEGRTLSNAIRQVRQLPPTRAVKIAAQIADALAAAHTKGIVHRDLKPDNVFLIKRAGSSDYVKVLDFGMARLRPELGGVQATQSGALVGTPAYMSPEQARGEKVGPAADIYSLGVVLFHMLTGQLPFTADSLTMMLIQIVQETPPSVDKLAKDTPTPLVDLVKRCLEKDAAKRPPDMATLRRELFESVGLPFETTQSVMGSQSPLAPDAAAIAMGETIDSQRPTVNPLAETSAPGLGVAATTAPMWSGQSSLSAGAAEISTAPKPRPRWPLIAGGVGALAIAIGIGVTMMGKGGHEAKPAATPAPATQPAAPPSSPPLATTPPATTPVEAPVAPPPATPPVAEATGSGSAASAVVDKTAAKRVTSLKKAGTAKTSTAKTGTGSGSAAPVATPPVETKPPDKVDLTKQLVGPKPPGT